MRHFVRVLGQRLVVAFERGVAIERQVELVDPAEVEAGAAQRVGWLERGETHQIRARNEQDDGFRKGSTHPTAFRDFRLETQRAASCALEFFDDHVGTALQ
jgi:hypothetical protein